MGPIEESDLSDIEYAIGSVATAIEQEAPHIAEAILQVAFAIREHTAELKRQTHPNRCPCEACRGKP